MGLSSKVLGFRLEFTIHDKTFHDGKYFFTVLTY